MQLIEMKLISYFSDYGKYQAEGIEIEYRNDGSIDIYSDVPDIQPITEAMEINFTTHHETLYEFISEYVIIDVADLNEITPALLHRRFLVGRATLICSIDSEVDEQLRFTRDGDVFTATDHTEEEHTVPANIQTIDALLIYTQYWFDKQTV